MFPFQLSNNSDISPLGRFALSTCTEWPSPGDNALLNETTLAVERSSDFDTIHSQTSFFPKQIDNVRCLSPKEHVSKPCLPKFESGVVWAYFFQNIVSF